MKRKSVLHWSDICKGHLADKSINQKLNSHPGWHLCHKIHVPQDWDELKTRRAFAKIPRPPYLSPMVHEMTPTRKELIWQTWMYSQPGTKNLTSALCQSSNSLSLSSKGFLRRRPPQRLLFRFEVQRPKVQRPQQKGKKMRTKREEINKWKPVHWLNFSTHSLFSFFYSAFPVFIIENRIAIFG